MCMYFSILLRFHVKHKPLSNQMTVAGVLGSSRHIINTQIINPPSPVLVSTHGKATKSCFFSAVCRTTATRHSISGQLKNLFLLR